MLAFCNWFQLFINNLNLLFIILYAMLLERMFSHIVILFFRKSFIIWNLVIFILFLFFYFIKFQLILLNANYLLIHLFFILLMRSKMRFQTTNQSKLPITNLTFEIILARPMNFFMIIFTKNFYFEFFFMKCL